MFGFPPTKPMSRLPWGVSSGPEKSGPALSGFNPLNVGEAAISLFFCSEFVSVLLSFFSNFSLLKFKPGDFMRGSLILFTSVELRALKTLPKLKPLYSFDLGLYYYSSFRCSRSLDFSLYLNLSSIRLPFLGFVSTYDACHVRLESWLRFSRAYFTSCTNSLTLKLFIKTLWKVFAFMVLSSNAVG